LLATTEKSSVRGFCEEANFQVLLCAGCHKVPGLLLLAEHTTPPMIVACYACFHASSLASPARGQPQEHTRDSPPRSLGTKGRVSQKEGVQRAFTVEPTSTRRPQGHTGCPASGGWSHGGFNFWRAASGRRRGVVSLVMV
jgi:hypothetical protein